jgi:3-(methylthio)propanoyl-CoA dehydrogenase
MTIYVPPLRDIRFALDHLADLPRIAALPGFEEANPDLIENILDEASRIAADVLAPLNRQGDLAGAQMTDAGVRTSPGWVRAWRILIEGGWNGLACPPEYGGLGLPQLLNIAVQEMWHSANTAFALCPMLTQGAVNAIALYGTAAQKARYLPRLVSGEWTGTMNLTEPSAGSDLAAIRSRAAPDGDAFRITGQKIFITYGDHDLTGNIIHLVLARLPDAPAGVKGISLFIVPKFLLDEDGNTGAQNDVTCVSLEHKIGIHGSPTAALSFGDAKGALGELVGEANRGLEYMFAMMNHARLNVGLQGLAIAERAYQQARQYARERRQGKPVGWTGGDAYAIIDHPDVRRMLMSMKARIEAMRGLLYDVAAGHDMARAHTDAAVREAAQRQVDLLTPIAKGWCTETGIDIASLGIQVHGGMGYVEDTGAAQYWRDSRITTIYEGTTGIQANDLVGRKIIRDGGAAANQLLAAIAADGDGLAGTALAADGESIAHAARAAAEAVAFLLIKSGQSDPRPVYAGAVPFLHLMGTVVGGHVLLRAAVAAVKQIAAGNNDPYWTTKIALARFYATHVLPQAGACRLAVIQGSGEVFTFDEALL